jgi:hypothetical protein
MQPDCTTCLLQKPELGSHYCLEFFFHGVQSADVKSAMGLMCNSIFSLSPGPIHLFKKTMDDAQTQILGPVMHTFGM